EKETSYVIEGIISGEITDTQAGAFLTSLATKGETEDEIFGIVETMRRHMKTLDIDGDVLDTCGTGGDGADTINVSTITAFICAAAGVKVAKHGNRSVSSKCGSFDVLEKLGVKIDMDSKVSLKCLEQVGITCLFAPLYHPAMKNIVPVRRVLGVRTVFNFIGPLLNPAKATHQLIGVSSRKMAEKLGNVLMQFGLKKVLLVNSDDGLDEISVAGPTQIFEFVQGRDMKTYKIEPEKIYFLNDVQGGEVEENAEIMKNILSGNGTDAQNEFIALNAGAALLASGVVETFAEGKSMAYELIKSGTGMKKLEELIKFGNNL
ncbi:anthranilate phosphoribosyltransferase, partial [bacterium]|nr:anthranilate phosphoribosyltransferase [bacterium]